jgi:EAL and modified HD-GYP domain-containing signal transduction protein
VAQYFIARQPILDRRLQLHAYELLFRGPGGGPVDAGIDDDHATAQVLTIGADAGLATLAGGYPAFINLPRRFLVEPDLLPLAPQQVVLEVLESVDLDAPVLAGMRELRARGYTIALDDVVDVERCAIAAGCADIVKLEIPRIAPDAWPRVIERAHEAKLRVLAEKVETPEEYERLLALGCDYFQGFFFARPKTLTGARLSANKIAMLQLLARINDPATDVDTLAQLVSRDVTLSVRALNYVNSAASALQRRIDSVREAIVYLGRNPVRSWVTLYLMANVDDKPSELISVALSRARFCEQLALEANRRDEGTFFTVGLFSILDALMDTNMTDVLEALQLHGELRDALIRRGGTSGAALLTAESLEMGMEPVPVAGIDGDTLCDLYTQARAWADTALSDMGLATGR